MTQPDSRRFPRPATKSVPMLRSATFPPREPSAPAAPSSSTSRVKTTRVLPGQAVRAKTGTKRRVAGEGEEENDAAMTAAVAAAKSREEERNKLVLIGSIGGGALLLLVILLVAVSSGGSSQAEEQRRRRKPVVADVQPEAPKAERKSFNYVRNTGSIVFVCSGSDKHEDKEVLFSACPGCSSKHMFAYDDTVSGYRCTSCKAVLDNAAIKCETCGRLPRVTHLKKIARGVEGMSPSAK